jgi:hypothetical protein
MCSEKWHGVCSGCGLKSDLSYDGEVCPLCAMLDIRGTTTDPAYMDVEEGGTPGFPCGDDMGVCVYCDNVVNCVDSGAECLCVGCVIVPWSVDIKPAKVK